MRSWGANRFICRKASFTNKIRTGTSIKGPTTAAKAMVTISAGRPAAIAASDPGDKGEFFDPAADKIYRHPTFYEIPDEVGHM